MREIRTSGSEGGARSIPCSYLYRTKYERSPISASFNSSSQN